MLLPKSFPPTRPATEADADACVATWVTACAARDGRAIDGVGARARPRFAAAVVHLLAEGPAGVEGFVLATRPGSGLAADLDDAAVLALLAVAPDRQTRGLGGELLRAATDALRALGYQRAVLHALVDNTAAIRLYEREGWHPIGEEFTHALLGRPMRSYLCELTGDALAQTSSPNPSDA